MRPLVLLLLWSRFSLLGGAPFQPQHESNASFLVYHFSSSVQATSVVFPQAPLSSPYLHVRAASLFGYNVGYVSGFNSSGASPVVSAPSELFVDLPLLAPPAADFVDMQDPASSAFAHKLWGLAVDGVPIYSGLLDNAVDFFHGAGAGTTLAVDGCGGSYGPTAANGADVRYHYRAMPSCLLPGQVANAASKRQQRVEDLHELLDAFAGVHGPHLLGYTLTGRPIYSPYDARGLLQTGLDNCNGKMINGTYAYFVTPSFPYVVGCEGPGVLAAATLGVAGEQLAATSPFVPCPGGHYPTPGMATNGCAACPAGTYAPVSYTTLPAWLTSASAADVAGYTCSGVCPKGSFCPAGSVAPVRCPAGRYGSSEMLGTAYCSGECPGGVLCRPGSTTATGVPCGDEAHVCPPGTPVRVAVGAGYYSVPEAAPRAGRAGQLQCGPGTWCHGGIRRPCPAGTYGSTSGLTTADCSGVCSTGFYCPQQATEPLPCPAGTYGNVTGLSTPACSGLCAPGYFCPAASTSPRQASCPAGVYGAEAGLVSAACSPVCEPGGAPTANAPDPVADKACAPRPCAAGYYCPPASTSPQQMPCGGVGVYCPPGAAAPIAASPGFYTTGLMSPPGGPQQDADNNTRTGQHQCEPGTFCMRGVRRPCPAGTYTDQYGTTSPTCLAPCAAGFFCETGSASPTQFPCGNSSVYCPPGSALPQTVPVGSYSVKTSESTPQDIQVCPPGYYCVAGVKRPCRAGVFASGPGAHTPSCGGPCSPGYYCPSASTSPRQVPCPAGRYGLGGDTTPQCAGACDAGYYCTAGSPSRTQNRCGGVYVFCPLGSAAPTNVSLNFFSSGGDVWTRSSQVFCNPTGKSACPLTTVKYIGQKRPTS